MNCTVPLQRLEGLATPEHGLTDSEASARRDRYGSNLIVETVSADWLSVARATARDPMLWFLLGASSLFGMVGQATEAIVLLLAMIPLFGMDAFLHRRTQASIEGLSSRLASRATVIRDGAQRTVGVTEVVPGDVAVIEAGDAFPADGLILQADQLQVDESALTGEAYPVHKQALASLPRHDDEARVEGAHWGFAGTRVLTGATRLRIIYTGGETLYGEIVRSAVSGSHERTPLQRAVANLVTLLVIIAAVICVLLAWVRFRQGYGLVDSLLSALTLAVAAVFWRHCRPQANGSRRNKGGIDAKARIPYHPDSMSLADGRRPVVSRLS